MKSKWRKIKMNQRGIKMMKMKNETKWNERNENKMMKDERKKKWKIVSNEDKKTTNNK
jgi:hypothetical protein